MKIARQKGTKDIYGKDILVWQFIEEKIRKICKAHNVSEIRTPVFEATELYARGVGDGTDIVNKEMYTFIDKGGRSITLRPELTAGVVRSYIENGMSSMTSPLKLWYTANMYRYEKMQKGRFREFAQFGVEIFGSESYLADIETIKISYEFFKEIGILDKLTLNINSIGCSTCRASYIQKLKDFLKENLSSMCETCKVRYEKNPLRILDCKENGCREILKNAPIITDCLCDDCKSDFEKLKNTLTALNIKYNVDSNIVRGLDYYNKTVYEWTSNNLGLAVGGGGRYDMLIESLSGPKTCAVGFGIGMDRIVLLLQEENLVENVDSIPDVYVALDENSVNSKVYEIISYIREKGYIVEENITSRNIKNQIKYADKIGAKFVILIGEDEISKNVLNVKNMENGEQKEILFDKDEILNIIGGK